MENKFVMNNFREIKKSLSEHFISFENSNLRESIRSLINSNEFSIKIKKHYITALLTGALYIENNDTNSILEDIVAMEMYMPSPLIHYSEIPYPSIICLYNVFDIIRDELWKNEPEFLLEIAKEQYERVWNGWTDSRDIGNLVYTANYFWEPVLQNLLSKYAGCESKSKESFSTPSANTLSRALTAFLRFGKTGHLGVQLDILMAGIGVIIPAIPICINTDNRISDINSRIMSGNGISSQLPSIAEEYSTFNFK